MKSENFELALDEIIWLITLLANQSIKIYNLKNKEKKDELTTEYVELMTSPLQLAEYKSAITEAMFKGTARNIESETDSKKQIRRVSDEETFTRLYYYGTVQMDMTPDDFWHCPLGLFLDLWECHKQFTGISKPKVEMFIDDVIPAGI